MEHTTALQALRHALPRLGDGDRNFAESLLKQADRKARPLSDKQWHWVRKLAERAHQPQPTPQTVEIALDVSNIVALFERAAQHLKFPKLLIRADDTEIRLALAGNKSKAPGSISVVGAYNSTWYGRIIRDGTYEPARNIEPDMLRPLIAVLKEFAADPASVATRYGKLTGICCFCSTPLSDRRSTDVGYGPTCADHYGLPWGNAKSPAATPAVDALAEWSAF